MAYVSTHVKNLYGLSPLILGALKAANVATEMSENMDGLIPTPSLFSKPASVAKSLVQTGAWNVTNENQFQNS